VGAKTLHYQVARRGIGDQVVNNLAIGCDQLEQINCVEEKKSERELEKWQFRTENRINSGDQEWVYIEIICLFKLGLY